MQRTDRKVSFRFLGIVLVLGVLLLSACSGASDNAAATSTAPVEAPSAAATVPPMAATDAAPQPTITQIDATSPTESATAPANPTATQAGESSVPADSVQAFPDPAQFTWVAVAQGFQKPLALTSLPGDPARMLIVEQPGTIRVVQDGKTLTSPFLDITAKVGSQGNEQGLLGIALHPQYAQNGFFYLDYTDLNGDTVIARFQVSPSDPNQADPASEKVLLQQKQPYSNHNGGNLAFGPDGFLYIGLGDGGSANDPQGNGQKLDTFLGKLLRIDVNSGDPYGIPADNPFANGQAGAKPEIWAYGLRNPWRFAFDRLTGDLYIGDVGQDKWEEVDFLPAGTPGGTNFGWNYREGTHDFRGQAPADAKLTEPIFDYPHGQGCSVTGGYVYRGQALADLRGVYLFADYCTGRVWGLLRGADGGWQSHEFFQEAMNITSFGQDAAGEFYAIDQRSGSILRLQRK